MKKWRPRIQSEYNVVDREGKIITSKEIIETLESLEVELSTARGEIERLKCCGNCDLYGHYCDPYSEGKIKDAGICDDWRPWEDQEARP